MPSGGMESAEEGCVKDTGREAPGRQQGEVEDPEG